MLHVEKRTQWDLPFFQKWLEVHRKTQSICPEVPFETLEDLKGFFHSKSIFCKNNDWEAYLVLQNGSPIARSAVSLPRYWEHPSFVPFGFFDGDQNQEALKLMLDLAQNWALVRGVNSLRGPIQGSFFSSYRWRVPHSGPVFYGEPVVPQYYLDQFQNAGFQIVGRWKTFRVRTDVMLKGARQVVERFAQSHEEGQIKFRSFQPKDWNHESKVIFDLFMDSYQKMPDFMPIAYEEFKEFYSPFRYIANPDYCYCVEQYHKPVGFLVAYRDPKEILDQAHVSKLPKLFSKLKALSELKRNKKTMLIPYTGKLDSCNVKGILGSLMLKVLEKMDPKKNKNDREFLAIYMADGSDSYKTLPPGAEVWAEYVIFQKDLKQKNL